MIERWREGVQACFEKQTVLRMPDVRDYVMTSSGDRISPSIERLREVLRQWPKWKA